MKNEKLVKLNPEPMVKEKSWSEFRETGLFWLINTMLQVFGWSLVYEREETSGDINRVYPARTKFRGFSTDVQAEAHKMIASFMTENAKELKEETEM